MEEVLKLAGKNRRELERVIAHYLSSASPDSLMSFLAITPGNDLRFDWRMVNAVFESSKSPDFSDSQTIHTITSTPALFNAVKLKRPHTCRYVRYRSPVGNCNVSEISFYDPAGNKIEGKHIGLSGSFNNWGDTGDKAFDGDIITFYDAVESYNSWTGLDFGEEKTIASIRYSPRIMGTGIYEGYEYELFCWINNEWKSIGKRRAAGQSVAFNGPRDALFYLSNNTAKKKGKVFFLLNGRTPFFYN